MVDFFGAMFGCGYSGVRVAAFFEKLAHFLAFVVKAEKRREEKRREEKNSIYLLPQSILFTRLENTPGKFPKIH